MNLPRRTNDLSHHGRPCFNAHFHHHQVKKRAHSARAHLHPGCHFLRGKAQQQVLHEFALTRSETELRSDPGDIDGCSCAALEEKCDGERSADSHFGLDREGRTHVASFPRTELGNETLAVGVIAGDQQARGNALTEEDLRILDLFRFVWVS